MPSLTIKDFEKIAWGWTEYTDPTVITNDNILTAYRLNQNYCKNKICRRNCRGNPFCLTGLGEARLSENIKNPQNETMSVLPNRVQGTSVGLKNLGATCYVNSLLQLLYHNKSFRDAILLWNPYEDPIERGLVSSSPNTVIGHLQQLFALMLYSKCGYIDPSPLVECLRLDTSTQQDAQEFSKLFISLLESSLSNQSTTQVKNIVSDIFRGEYMYVTRCCKCLTESVSPSMFYELVLNVKGHSTLNECLAEFLQEEKLDGANCYSCTTCQTKQEACRFIKLCSLPPVLNIQLLRFVYDREKGQKKKLKNVVQFPETLDMKEFVRSDSETSMTYNLSAVLIHKGTKASSGHFVAYIKDRETGTWNTFNDENVEKLEGKKLKLDEEDYEGGSKTKAQKLPKGCQSSTDAYMLVYTWEQHNPTSTEVNLSQKLQDYVNAQNKVFDDLCQEIVSSKKEDIERQEHLLNLYNCLTLENEDDLSDVAVMPVDWLMSWLGSKKEMPQQIDNTKLLCPHSRLDPTVVTSAKYVDANTLKTLYEQYGGGPQLTGSDILCKSCVSNTCAITRTRSKTLEESKEITSLLKKRMAPDEPGYFVSKYCLKTWRTRVLSHLEGESGERGKTNEVLDTCPGEPKALSSTKLSPSANLSSEQKSNLYKLKYREKRLSFNKTARVTRRRKSDVLVSVHETYLRDCYVLCRRMQLGLIKPDKNSSNNNLLANCKKLKIMLKKILISPTEVNSVVKVGDENNKCTEKCEEPPGKQLKDSDELQCDNNKRVPCSKHENEIYVESVARPDLNEDVVCNPQNEQNGRINGDISENLPPLGHIKIGKCKPEDEEGNAFDDEMESSKEFNDALRCPHGDLSIIEINRRLVPVRVWEILRQYFPSAPEFPQDTHPCHQCQNLASKDEVVKQLYYDNALNQKRALGDLINLRNRPQLGQTHEPIYILPKTTFYQPWSAFLKAATRRDGGSVVDPPASLKTDSLLCVHGLLHYNPQLDEDLARLVPVTSQEWQILLTLYVSPCEVTVAQDFSTIPALCGGCISERLQSEQREKLNYERAKLYIRMVSAVAVLDEPPDGGSRKRARLLEDGSYQWSEEPKKALKSPLATRRSSRNRKAPGQKDVSFYVSSDLTIRELKQKILKQLAVAPFDQHLYTQDGRELLGDFDTLASLGILPNSTLLLQVDEPKESFDDVMAGCSTPNEPELGFKGTGLLHAY